MASGASARRKGHTFQAETAALWRRYGLDVNPLQRNLANQSDNAIVLPSGQLLIEETKRAERAKIGEWWPVLADSCPRSCVPVLTWRRSRWPSLSMLETEHLARLLGER